MKTVMAPTKLGEFDFQCPRCKEIHHRSMWSIAHYNVPHTYTCACGNVIVIVK